ncbi:MAG: sulfite exporter TauE/SafE family protein [Clostridia bacterium]|nr:sulfite exporter TauE/SafE family protein [Clostridia bacterium]
MKKRKWMWREIGGGAAIGFINGFLGAGGGMLAVPLLRGTGLSQKEAHANAVAVILPITALSAGIYLWRGQVAFSQAAVYMPAGLAGAWLGTGLMQKISGEWLRRIFGGLMIYAGVRLLLR